ncbi:MAG: hypothetical protein KBS64_06535 [Treponema sp.]|nr:hypothetical protein [Candidatus Treponema equi]
MSDMSENKSELDEYGVWVKKPPVGAPAEETSPAEEPVVDASFIEQAAAAATDKEIEQDLAEFDIDALGDFEVPSFNEEPAETNVADTTVSEKPLAEESITEEPSAPETPVVEDTIIEEFAIEEPVVAETSVSEDTTAEDFATEETSVSSDDLDLADFSLDAINDDNGPMTFEEPAVEETASTEDPAPTESAPEQNVTEEVSFEDGEIDLDAFMSDDSAPSSDSTPDGDIDLSAFMGDGGDAPDFGNGDIDLEAFMGSEGFASDKQEQEEIEDADPLDIDLDFETTEVELQDAEANGDVSDIETSSSSYTGMDETTDVEDFDALFDNIVDETPAQAAEEKVQMPKTEAPGNTEEIDLSDFGFDDDSDNQNPILGDNKEEPKKQGPVDYEMNVDDEDANMENSSASLDETVVEDDDSDDIDVDISQDDEVAVQKDQETDLSSPDDSFDIDSILNSVEDENGGTVSFESSEKPIEEPVVEDEVTDSEPMFQEPQESDLGEDLETSVMEETIFEEPSVENIEEAIDETAFEEPSVDNIEETIDETAFEEPSVDNIEEAIDETAFEEPSVDNIEETIDETAFEEPSVEVTEEIVEETAFDEPFVSEPVLEEVAADEPDAEETIVETSEVMDYNDSQDASENEEIDLEDFMGEEGFTDGGPGVTGPYNEDGTLIVRDPAPAAQVEEEESAEEEPAVEETIVDDFESVKETSDEIDMTKDFEEPVIYDNIDSEITMPEFTEPELSQPEVEETEIYETEVSESEVTEPEVEETPAEPDYSNISAFADKKPEYDMTGVTLSLDDFEKLSSAPVVEPVPEAVQEEPAPQEEEEFQDEPETYSVFIKTESSSGVAEVAGPVSEDIKTEEPVATETAESAEETMDAFDASSVLSQISNELESLRSEIKDLKSEFEEIKKNGIQTEPSADSAVDTDIDLPESSEDTGFFNDTDEDDTIALSGDELSNILSTAEFTSQSGDSLDTGLNMDFENETLEEPVFEETVEEETPETEEEISVPTVDDVLVESSSTDLMDEGIPEEEPAVEEIDAITEDDIPSPTLESLDLPEYDDEQEELTDDNIEFLKDSPEEDENLETGISEQPVEEVFNNWDAASEPEDEVIAEPEIEDEIAVDEPVVEEPAVEESSSNEIPSSMKEEIKSVLSYMDQLLENLPEDKIAEFAQSEQFETYKKLFAELGLS